MPAAEPQPPRPVDAMPRPKEAWREPRPCPRASSRLGRRRVRETPGSCLRLGAQNSGPALNRHPPRSSPTARPPYCRRLGPNNRLADALFSKVNLAYGHGAPPVIARGLLSLSERVASTETCPDFSSLQ